MFTLHLTANLIVWKKKKKKKNVFQIIAITRDDTKVYFPNVTNDVTHRHFDSLDVT